MLTVDVYKILLKISKTFMKASKLFLKLEISLISIDF